MVKKIIKQRVISFGKYAQLIVFYKPVYVHHVEDRIYIKTKNAEKRDDSLSRTRSILYQRIHANIREHGNYKVIFLTLTISENLSDLKQANYLFSSFIKRLSYYSEKKLKYIAIPEFQERGAVHYHVMFFNLPFIHYETLQDIWGHGYIRVELGRNIKNIAAYMTKYLSKDILDQRLRGHRILLTSKGLKKSTVYDNEEIAIFNQHYIIKKQESLIRTPEKKITLVKTIKYEN